MFSEHDAQGIFEVQLEFGQRVGAVALTFNDPFEHTFHTVQKLFQFAHQRSLIRIGAYLVFRPLEELVHVLVAERVE